MTPDSTKSALAEIRVLIQRMDAAERAMRTAQRSKSPSRLEDAWFDHDMAVEAVDKAIARNARSLVHVVRNYIVD